MYRIAGALLLCGLLVGCGSSTPATLPDDAESLRRAKEEGKKEAEREKDVTKGTKDGRTDRGED